MLYDAINVFETKLKNEAARLQDNKNNYTDMERKIKLLVDNYVPKDGTYVLINMDRGFACEEPLEIQLDKKSGVLKGITDSRYPYIRYLDYNSKLIEMNKPVDAKKVIHSNQIFSFWIKKESIAEKKITENVVEGYYNTLMTPVIKYTKPNAKTLYSQVEKELGEPDTRLAQEICAWIKKWLLNPEILPVDYSGKDYLKLFFIFDDMQMTKQLYEKENRRYVIPNIYNNNDYNVKTGSTILGMPSNNMGLNAKKPFLENKNRKTSAPYLVDMDRVILQSQFFDYLWGHACKGNVNVYIDYENQDIKAVPDKGKDLPEIESGMYLRIKKGKEVEILDSDVVMNLTPNLAKTFCFKRIVADTDNEKLYGQCNKVEELAAVIDEVFFDKMLGYNYFTDAMDLPSMDGTLADILLSYRGRLFAWLYKTPQCDIKQVIQEMAVKLIKNKVADGYVLRAGIQLDFLLSLEDYFSNNREQEEHMKTLQETFSEHIDMQKDWEFSDSEYYYAVGQMVSYFLTLSKSAKKPLSMANQFLNAEHDSLIKEKMSQMFIRYDYAIDADRDMRAKNVISHIMMYEPKCSKVMQRELIAGLTANSAFYAKKEQTKED